MSIVIERAKFGEGLKFFDLWIRYSDELAALGGDRPRAEKPLELYRTLFSEYTSGRLPGVALFAMDAGKPVGVSLWGVPIQPEFGPRSTEAALGWGVYVVPSHRKRGISTQMRERSVIDLDEMGVQAAIGVVLLTNHAGIESSRNNGFEPTEVIGVMNLREQAERIKRGDPHKRFKHEGYCPMCERD